MTGSSSDFKLQTKNFSSVANQLRTLAQHMRQTKEIADDAVNMLYFSWAGDARNEFQVRYRMFERNLVDLQNSLWDLYEDILVAEDSYLAADVQVAKQLEG